MKVIFVLDALINAGTEKSTFDIIRHFSPSTEAIVVYAYPNHELKVLYESSGIRLHFLGLQMSTSLWRGVRPLREFIQKEKPDLVVSSIYRANIMARIACWQTKTRLIGTFVSDSYGKQRTRNFSWRRKLAARFYYWIDRLTARIPYGWIANSTAVATSNMYFLNLTGNRVKVIYRGRDASLFPAWVPPKGQQPFKFVYVGRLLASKGLFELVLAFQKLVQVHENCQLHLYGKGTIESDLDAWVKRAGLQNKVVFHGSIPTGWEAFYGAHVFVFPSHFEGFSGSLIEAMMVGIPVICSNIPMNTEAITHLRTGLVHQVSSVPDLLNKLLYSIEHYDTRMLLMSNKAQSEARERFHIKRISQQYEAQLRAWMPDR